MARSPKFPILGAARQAALPHNTQTSLVLLQLTVE